MANKLINKRTLDYIKNKKLRPAFSYKDVWNEKHATAFTVEKAVADGTTFGQFKMETGSDKLEKFSSRPMKPA